MGGLQATVGARLFRLAISVLACGVFAGFLATAWFQRGDGTSVMSWGTIAVAWIVAAVLALVASRVPPSLLSGLGERVLRLPLGIGGAIAVGIVLRITVALVLQPQAASDGASYLALAQRLVAEGAYHSDGTLAFWPPGLPLALAPLLALGLPARFAVLVLGVAAFVASAVGLARLVGRLGAPAWAGLAAWMLALWPTHVLCAGLPEKELLVIAILPWAVERAIVAYRGSWAAAATAGVLMGLAVLVQPSLQLLPPAAALLAAVLSRRVSVKGLGATSIAVIAMLAVVSPWTVRNLTVLGAPVFVSTNGGDVLYRANNELATGAYTPAGAVDLRQLDELARDRESKRLAVEWITGNPGGFGHLVAVKSLLFLGDDSYGAFVVFQRGKVTIARSSYLAVKLGSAMPWLVMWFLMLAFAVQRARWPRDAKADAAWFVLLPTVYLLAIHSVFESGPKYHLPLLATSIAAFAWMLSLRVVSASSSRSPVGAAGRA